MDDAVLPELPARGPGRIPVVATTVAIGLTIAALFAVTTGFDHVGLGDPETLLSHDRWHGFGEGRLGWMLGTSRGGLPRPLAWMSLGLDHALFGGSPAVLHATNVVLHGISTALLFLLGLRVLSTGAAGDDQRLPWLGAALAALFWGAHPLRVEVVAWATARGEALGGTLLLGAAILWLDAWRRPTLHRGRLAGALLLLAASIAADPGLWGAPVALTCLLAWQRRRSPLSAAGRLRPGRTPALAALLLVPCAVAAAAAYSALPRSAEAGPPEALAAGAAALVRPLVDFVWPLALHPAYDPPPGFPTTVDATLWIQLALATLLLGALAGGLRERRGGALAGLAYVSLCGGAWLIGREIVGADRFAHAASIPLCLALGGLVTRARGWQRQSSIVAACAAVLACSAATWMLLPAWRDAPALWEHVLTLAPHSERALAARGESARVRAGTGDRAALDTAIATHRRSLEHGDHRAWAHAGLGACLLDRGEPEVAQVHLERAVELAPWHAGARRELGGLLLRQRDLARALPHLETAVLLDPESADAWFTLGRTRVLAGERAAAADAFERAVELRPGDGRAREELQRLRDGS